MPEERGHFLLGAERWGDSALFFCPGVFDAQRGESFTSLIHTRAEARWCKPLKIKFASTLNDDFIDDGQPEGLGDSSRGRVLFIGTIPPGIEVLKILTLKG